MAYRYCPNCEQWYQTHEYTVDKFGETVCKKDAHGSLHGYMSGSTKTQDELRRALKKSYISDSDVTQMVDAAVRQGLIR